MSIERLKPTHFFDEERLAALKNLVPEAFADGKINWSTLKDALGGELEEAEEDAEHFGLSWPGKREARRLAGKPSTGTLIPVKGEGIDEDTTRNIYIEGENLEVLKLLRKSYTGQVKMIYIDPPYNTGNDFVYDDDFTEPLQEYLKRTGQIDGEGKPTTTNKKADGRFHSKWLSMMYPRLRLARELLRDDGVIFVSIDDNEVHHLRMLMNEVFGEENFIVNLVYDKNRKNDSRFFSSGHEYMLCFSKDKQYQVDIDIVFRAPKEGIDEIKQKVSEWRVQFDNDWIRIGSELIAYFSTFTKDDPRQPLSRYRSIDEKGPYRTDGNPSWPGGRGPTYDVLHPITKKPCKKPSRGWVWPTFERMRQEIESGHIVFGVDEKTIPSVRTNLFEKSDQVMRSVVFSYAQTSTQDLMQYFDGTLVFENPKNYKDIKQIVNYVSTPDDIILDFFSGSATTAHAVFDLNKEDGGKRQFILVQMPEATPTDSEAAKAGYKNIAEIGKERIRRVIKKIKDEKAGESEGTKDLDLGFKVFKLAKSHYKPWENYHGESVEIIEELFAEFVTPLVPNWRQIERGLLTEILLLEGFPLDSTIAPVTGHTDNTVVEVSSSFHEHHLLVCLDDQLAPATVNSLQLRESDRFICLDSAIDTQTKTRLTDKGQIKTI